MTPINLCTTPDLPDQLANQMGRLSPIQGEAFMVSAIAHFLGTDLPEINPRVLIQQAILSFSETEEGREYLEFAMRAGGKDAVHS